VRADGDVAEQAEPHARVAQCVMSRRTHGAEAAPRSRTERQVERVEHRAGAGRARRPRPLADEGVGVEPCTTRRGELLHHVDVRRVVREHELVGRRVARLAMLEPLEQLEVVPERPRNRPQPSDVLGMPPAGVVTATVGVGEVG
jgi:hypothetical protein